jgi:hypothetical protein
MRFLTKFSQKSVLMLVLSFAVALVLSTVLTQDATPIDGLRTYGIPFTVCSSAEERGVDEAHFRCSALAGFANFGAVLVVVFLGAVVIRSCKRGK